MKTSKKRASPGKKKVTGVSVPEPVVEPVLETPILEPAMESTPPPETPVADPQTSAVQPVRPLRQPIRLLLVALLFGWAFDFLFWEQRVGINLAILLGLGLVGGLFVLFTEGFRPGRNGLWLLVPFVFFAIITFIRRESLTAFLAYTFTLLTLGLFTTNYLGGRWYLYRLSDYFYKFLLFIGDMIARPFGFFRQVGHSAAGSNGNVRALPLSGLARGFVIALPVVLCFGSLLASADLVFQQKLDDFFDSEKILENIQRLFLIALFAYLLAGTILHAATGSADEKVTDERQSLLKPFLGFTESAVVLGSVISLFLLFVMVQFRYFFGGETNIGVAGYTYSQYARRGFNELVLVAFFSLVMLIVLSSITRRDGESQKRLYSVLSVGVVALVMVILVSAYQRISLAIGWHGYSRLRLYPRIFLIWLGLLLITIAILEIARRERYFTLAGMLAALGFAVMLTLFNVDAAIVKRNVYRSWHGRNLNVPHLASLSTDAVPALAEDFMSTKLPTSTREGVGAILACYKYFENTPHVSEYDWRSFNYSGWKAHQVLEEIRPGLAGYVVRYNKYPVRVRTPHGVLYPCTAYDAANDRE